MDQAKVRALGAALVVGVLAPGTSAWANHSYPATYTGTFASGGSLEFDVSTDGTSVTRFKVTNVQTASCGTISGETTGGVPIQTQSPNHPFVMSGYPASFSGSFPAPQTAQGSYEFRTFGFPSCSSSVGWSATTPTPARVEPKPGTPAGAGGVPSGADVTAPILVLAGKTTQKAGASVAVEVSSPSEASLATATGRVSVPGAARAAKSYKLRSASAQIAKGGKTTLRLKIPARVQKAIKRALRKRKRVTASVKVVLRDAAQNTTTRNRQIKLRR